MKDLLVQTVIGGLKKKAINTCSKWTEAHRVMTKTFIGPWSFKNHPWLRAMHDDSSEVIAVQKGTQMGVSEYAINKTFFRLDVDKADVLYLLPNSKPDASDFSVGRFEPALQASEYISSMFSDTKNVGMKKAGSAILYIRGSRSESQLKSIPTGYIVYDEYDEMPDGTRALAQERMSGQIDRQEIIISTPTRPDFGINREYLASDQKHFFFKCPSCGQWEELTYELHSQETQSIVIVGDRFNDPRVEESYLQCKHTKRRLEHNLKHVWLQNAIWVPQKGDTSVSGYHINQLYSTVSKPSSFAKSKLQGDTNPAYAQEFFKSKLGLPYIEKGAKVTDEELNSSLQDYKSVNSWQGGYTMMGVDVGTRLHYEISEYSFHQRGTDINSSAKAKVLKSGWVKDFEELDLLMAAFHVVHCVIDANPERRKAREFAERHIGRVSMCYYIAGLSSTNPIIVQPENFAVKVDRTFWLDLTLSRFRAGSKALPADISEEYKAHMKSLVRVYDINGQGDISSKYVNDTSEDHLAHAANYCEIALYVATSYGASYNI